MTRYPGEGLSGVLRWCLVPIGAAVVVLLAGCAAPSDRGAGGQGAGSGRSDLVTESDEPEARKRARIRLELATGYFVQGQTTVALDEVKQALVTDPTYADAYNLRGLVYMQLNDPGLAEDSFRRALQLRPNSSDTLHNLGWFLCQNGRMAESMQQFARVLADPQYASRPKTLLAQGLCQMRAGQVAEAEQTLMRSYELDAGNPVTGYNLALLAFQRSDLQHAQFYIRRLNNSEMANAETLWLGIRVERRMGNREAMEQLSTQLRRRYPASPEAAAMERGAFDG
jgi:type IV pilus assembly protein PilF